nr:ribonuclease H-like domain-containing protein [Tanacetum cinerariifolium]
MNYQPVTAGNQSNLSAGNTNDDAAFRGKVPEFNGRKPESEEELLQFKMQKVWVLVDLPNRKRAIGHTLEEGINYEEVFAPFARIEVIRLFLPYVSFMRFMVYQMDVKTAFLYETIEEEVYVCQPPGFKDPDYPDKVYKVVKALYGLHLAPRAWYETLANYLLENGIQVKQKPDGIFISQVKRIFRYLKGKPHLGLWYPKDLPFNLVAYLDSDYAGASLDRKSITGGCQFFGYRLISWQCKKQTVVATPSTVVEYVVAASCCAQVLWIQNQLLDYGGITADIDEDKDVTLKNVAVVAKDVAAEIEENADDDELEPDEPKEVVEVVTTAKLMTEVVTAAIATITATDTPITAAALTVALSAARRKKGVVIRDPIETATPSTIIHSKPKSKDKGKGILVEEPKSLKKQARIEQDKAYARELEAELNKNINWDDVIDQVQRKEKEDNVVMRYQALKRKPQTKAQARTSMMIYLRNMAGFKMDYFKEMSYDDIRQIIEKYFNSNVAFLEKTKEQMEEEDSRALKRASESQAENAAKKQKLDKEVEELKKHLQIVPNDEDDVYTEATSLARKVPVVDYKIYTENKKPYYKIIRADGSL